MSMVVRSTVRPATLFLILRVDISIWTAMGLVLYDGNVEVLIGYDKVLTPAFIQALFQEKN